MIEKIKKIEKKLKRKLPDCIINYGVNPNTELVDFFIFYDRRKKYMKITMIKEKLNKININLLVNEIKTRKNKQYYGIESNIIVFDKLTGNHVPRLD